ncbi:RICIN domain-containing protein [Microbacterium sp. QXD-8]|uniref:RICIN domain-containing protein n=1 Tax=Microbacterium psychrotolerans TaxID=3068321 RepID=A0ABU0Z351_9MICO|nr:RICIN domain-containing protein [Microbacterium sp. QXD-8]MDQ7879009.1 RICIN domain-containing protein [Microbacterium sp. QXD-8]
MRSTRHADTPASGRCLDTVGGGTGNGTRAHIWDCHAGASQKWTLPG